METLSLTHESIVTKPIKARVLYEATQQLAETKRSVVKRVGGSTAMDKGYGKVSTSQQQSHGMFSDGMVAEVPVENPLCR